MDTTSGSGGPDDTRATPNNDDERIPPERDPVGPTREVAGREATHPGPELSAVVPGGGEDEAATQQYQELIRSLHDEWEDLESRGDDSVQLSGGVRGALTEAIRADARHGARVQMPPTDLGSYSLTELALRTLVRTAVDDVDGALCLRVSIDYSPVDGWGVRGRPERVRCRISVAMTTPDLPALAEHVRAAVDDTLRDELGLDGVTIDIHIEDLHEQ